MNGASMILQQRAATRLLLLVCLLVLNCAAQPLARLALLDHAVSCQTLPQFASADDQADKGTPASVQPNSCQLNGKWLSAASLLCVEQLFFAIAFVIALLVPLSRRAPALPPHQCLAARAATAPHPLRLAGMSSAALFQPAVTHFFARPNTCRISSRRPCYWAACCGNPADWPAIRGGSPAPRTVTPRSGCKPTAASRIRPASCSMSSWRQAGRPTGTARVKGHCAPDPVG